MKIYSIGNLKKNDGHNVVPWQSNGQQNCIGMQEAAANVFRSYSVNKEFLDGRSGISHFPRERDVARELVKVF